MSTDCILLTALTKELESVLFQFRHFRAANSSNQLSFVYFETTAPNGMRVVVGTAPQMGQVEAVMLARESVEEFKPKTVLLVGIAGGMDRGIALGDVVVSEQIVDYEIGKVSVEGFGPRWSVYRPDAHLLAKAKAWTNQNWQAYIRSQRPLGSQKPLLHSGVFLSGNKVLANEEAAGALRSVWRKAAAVDMEAAGVAAALWHMEKRPAFLVFKGICDYADSAKDDQWQSYASDAAASCALSFVLDQLQPSDIQYPGPDRSLLKDGQMKDRALRESLTLAYSRSELKLLAFDLGVDWEELPQGSKSEIIVELIQYIRRRGKFSTLIEVVNRDRDNLLKAYSSV